VALVATKDSSSSQGSSGSPRIDYEALDRGESPGEGIAPMGAPVAMGFWYLRAQRLRAPTARNDLTETNGEAS
jgi:hypothetical protein